MQQEQGPKIGRIGQIRKDLAIVRLNIDMLQRALDGKSGSSVDPDYRATTEIWVGELRGMEMFGRHMLGEATLGEILEDANTKTMERFRRGSELFRDQGRGRSAGDLREQRETGHA